MSESQFMRDLVESVVHWADAFESGRAEGKRPIHILSALAFSVCTMMDGCRVDDQEYRLTSKGVEQEIDHEELMVMISERMKGDLDTKVERLNKK